MRGTRRLRKRSWLRYEEFLPAASCSGVAPSMHTWARYICARFVRASVPLDGVDACAPEYVETRVIHRDALDAFLPSHPPVPTSLALARLLLAGAPTD